LRLLPTQRIVAPVRVSATAPTYVMYVTRRYFYNVGVLHLERTSTPVHEIAIEGAPILRIHRLSPARIPQLTQLWRREAEANRQWWDFHQWMQAHAPEQLTRVVVVLDAAYRADRLPEAVDYLRGELPADSPHRLEVVGDAYAWLQTHLWAYKNLDEHRAPARAQAQAAQAKAQAGDR
jgi:hypothetical protein